MKLENSYEINEKYYFEIIKRKKQRKIKRKIKSYYKYIILAILITLIIFVCSLIILRAKKTDKTLYYKIITQSYIESKYKSKDSLIILGAKKKVKTLNYKKYLPQSYIESKNKSEQLMKMVNYDEKYANATKCFTHDPEKVLCFYQFLVPKKVVGKNLKCIGPTHEGGYVLLDDMKNILIAYSIGIDHEISFDKALADKNIDIYMYDHTIQYLLYNNPKFHWKKIGISGISNKSNYTKTLKEMLEENGHINEKI